MNKNEKLQHFCLDIQDYEEFKVNLNKIYCDEFEEKFEDILNKRETEFMSTFSKRICLVIENMYSDDCFDNVKLIELMRGCEKNIYENHYKENYKILSQAWKTYNKYIDDIQMTNDESFNFRKHCRFSENMPKHNCQSTNKNLFSDFIKVYGNVYDYGSKSNLLSVTHIICKYCKKCYFSNSILLECSFCCVSFYTGIENENIEQQNENKNDNINYDIQPATWEKYHCSVINNNQMKCIQCNDLLYINLKENILLCFNTECLFHSDPSNILWLCIICNQEFTANAKIYNPLEHKVIKLGIKDAILNGTPARPIYNCCEESGRYYFHKKDCPGQIFIGEINNQKMVICEKCKSVTNYHKFIWTCPICNTRFRGDKRKSLILISECDESLLDNKIVNQSNFKSMISNIPVHSVASTNSHKQTTYNSKSYHSGNSYENYIYINKITSGVGHDLGDDNDTNPSTSRFSKSTLELQIKDEFDIDDYQFLRKIGQGSYGNIYEVIDMNNNKFAIKKIIINDQFDLDYVEKEISLIRSLNHQNILKIYGISRRKLDATTDALFILMELALHDLGKEIKSCKVYSLVELYSLTNQITSALSYLQKNNVAHRDIKPQNILVFPNGVYKLSDFGEASYEISNILFRGTELFLSPILYNSLKKFIPRSEINHNIFKSDCFSFGLCLLYAATSDIEPLYEIRKIEFDSSFNQTNMKILKILTDRLNKILTSTFINLIYSMLSFDEDERIDFHELEIILKQHMGNYK